MKVKISEFRKIIREEIQKLIREGALTQEDHTAHSEESGYSDEIEEALPPMSSNQMGEWPPRGGVSFGKKERPAPGVDSPPPSGPNSPGQKLANDRLNRLTYAPPLEKEDHTAHSEESGYSDQIEESDKEVEISAEKAKTMLKHGHAHGKPLSKKQKGLLGLIAGGEEPTKTKGK